MKNKIIKPYLSTYCELHWWNFGKKTLGFKGSLEELLKKQGVSYIVRKTDGLDSFIFHFTNSNGISYKVKSILSQFPDLVKRFLQMELVRMGYKSQLYVSGTLRQKVTVNH